jgi:transposase InsO family protein
MNAPRVLAVLNSQPYRDLAIPQVWARELDEGRYWCSESSMYRIARDAEQSRERRAQATHPPRVRPELVAHGPSEVWSWDITALKGPRKGEWYKLCVVLDIFSRYATGWLVANAEDAVVAKDFLAGNLVIPHTIHADRGGSMTSKPVSEMMIDLGVCRSHSRPRTSNDNPYSEAQFKTLKYVPDFPDRFGSLAGARAFCDRFFPPVLPHLQPRTPPLRNRHAHPRLGPLRHRDRGPSPPPGHPRPCPPRAPRAIPPPSSTPTPARACLDQPARSAANSVRSTV